MAAVELDAFTSDTIQHPPPGFFNADALQWYKNGTEAFIHIARLKDFVQGEGGRDESDCLYKITKTEDKLMYSGKSTVRFWCSFGPEDARGKRLHTLPEEIQPKKGKGSRKKSQRKLWGGSVFRGCQAHFCAITYKERPGACLIRWVQRKHVDCEGRYCHGAEDESPFKAMSHIRHRLSKDCLEFVRRLLLTGVPPTQIIYDYQRDLRALCRHSNVSDAIWARDLQLVLKDVHNVQQSLRFQMQQYSSKDPLAVLMWIQRHPEQVLYYQKPIAESGQPFILVWATPWMQSKLATLGHGKTVAMDGTFATNKYEYSLFSLLCYDAFQNGVPCCWALTQTHTAADLALVLQKVKDRVNQVRLESVVNGGEWMPSSFMVDDAGDEHNALRFVGLCSAIFPGVPIILCLWHVRRAWQKQLDLKVKNPIHKADMSRQLGEIMYTWSEDGEGMSGQFMHRWKDLQGEFVKYYNTYWHGRVEWWVKHYRKFAHCNQNTNGSIERYHRTMKSHLNASRKEKRGRKICWLLHMLSDVVEHNYWCLDKLKDHGRLRNKIIENTVHASIMRAKKIPNEDVQLVTLEGRKVGFVKSTMCPQTKHECVSYDEENAACTCGWAVQGNMCKHQLKCLIVDGYNEVHLLYVLGTKMGTRYGGFSNLQSGGVTRNMSTAPTPPMVNITFPQNLIDIIDEINTTPEVDEPEMTTERLLSMVSAMCERMGPSKYWKQQAWGRVQDACLDMYRLKSRADCTGEPIPTEFNEGATVEPYKPKEGMDSSMKPHLGLVDRLRRNIRRKRPSACTSVVSPNEEVQEFVHLRPVKRVSMQKKLDDEADEARRHNLHQPSPGEAGIDLNADLPIQPNNIGEASGRSVQGIVRRKGRPKPVKPPRVYPVGMRVRKRAPPRSKRNAISSTLPSGLIASDVDPNLAPV